MIDLKLLTEKLKALHQQHLLQNIEKLSVPQRTQFLNQLTHLDIPLFSFQQQMVLNPNQENSDPIEPFTNFSPKGSLADFNHGKQLIADGKVGCLLVAGGQGSRLGYDHPKGMFPVSVIKHKSLFQLFAEKTLAASKQAQRPLPLAIMTSLLNDGETKQFFRKHRYFGLQPSQVFFFSQDVLPLLDTKGNLFLETPDRFAEAPNGNGGALKQFVDSGIWDQWQKLGIEQIVFVLVDNPLADPFDAELVGFHAKQKVDITIKCTKKEHPEEKVGLIVKQAGKIKVKEYTELSEEEQKARLPNGDLKHACANLSLFCFSMPFIKQIATGNSSQWPLHKAFKAVKYLDDNQKTVKAEKPMAWKFEYFIFDALLFTQKVAALMYPRQECFSPLKNKTGANSLATVQSALQYVDRLTYEKISGTIPPHKPFELSQEFYYPSPQLLKKWQGRPLPEEPYIFL